MALLVQNAKGSYRDCSSLLIVYSGQKRKKEITEEEIKKYWMPDLDKVVV
jgi:hypothetical protein